jgi:hypothetical protein
LVLENTLVIIIVYEKKKFQHILPETLDSLSFCFFLSFFLSFIQSFCLSAFVSKSNPKKPFCLFMHLLSFFPFTIIIAKICDLRFWRQVGCSTYCYVRKIVKITLFEQNPWPRLCLIIAMIYLVKRSPKLSRTKSK